MTRGWLLSLLAALSLAVVLSCSSRAVGQGKEAEEKVLGKSTGQWINILRDHKQESKWRRAALLALGYKDGWRTGMFAILEAVANDPDTQVRLDAVKLLGRLGPEPKGSLKALAGALQNDKADEVRETAATILSNDTKFKAVYLQDYVEVLAGALKDPHPGTRLAVVTALRNMGEYAKPAMPSLFETAKKDTELPLVRAVALHILGRQAKEDSRTVPLMVELLVNDKNPLAVREAAVEGLGRAGSGAADVIAALGKTLAAPQIELRRAGAQALTVLGGKAKAAWPDIKARLSMAPTADKKTLKPPAEPDSGIRNNLIRLTGALGKEKPDAIGILADLAADEESTENRIAAIQELGDLGPSAKAALPTLERISTIDARAAVRNAADRAIKLIKGA